MCGTLTFDLKKARKRIRFYLLHRLMARKRFASTLRIQLERGAYEDLYFSVRSFNGSTGKLLFVFGSVAQSERLLGIIPKVVLRHSLELSTKKIVDAMLSLLIFFIPSDLCQRRRGLEMRQMLVQIPFR